jgi:hypothetical protein
VESSRTAAGHVSVDGDPGGLAIHQKDKSVLPVDNRLSEEGAEL